MRTRDIGRVIGALVTAIVAAGAGEARAQNIVQNPGFTGGLGGWTPLTSTEYTVSWDPAEGSAAAGAVAFSMPVTAPGNGEIYILRQCAPAAAGTLYDVGGSFKYPGSVAIVPAGGLVVQAFSDASCTTSVQGPNGFGLSSGGSPPDTWLTPNYPKFYMTPAATVAVRILLRVNFIGPGAFAGWFDDITIVPSNLDYHTLAPCRLVDTRGGGAPIGGPVLTGQETRPFTPTGLCGIPNTAKALSVNVTVADPSSTGNLRLFPQGQPVPTISTINYSAGQTRANNAVVTLGFLTGGASVFVGQPAGTTVHLIVDVNGYFE